MSDKAPDGLPKFKAVVHVLEEFDCHGNVRVDWFARGDKSMEVNLMDTRAADGLLIRYDFARDGWSISQASTFSWEADDPNAGDPDWQEVAFVKAWARARPASP